MAKQSMTELLKYPELELKSGWTKLIVTKVLKGAEPCIDVRIYQHYPNSDIFTHTKKGIFLSEIEWKDKVLPFLNEIFNDTSTQNP